MISFIFIDEFYLSLSTILLQEPTITLKSSFFLRENFELFRFFIKSFIAFSRLYLIIENELSIDAP